MKVLLGVTGSIAAYKSVVIARLLTKSGHEVKTILTRGGENFISSLSISNLTVNDVFTEDDFWIPNQKIPLHIELARWPDVVVVAPATMHFLGKLAHGLADDLLTSTIAAIDRPVLLAPAMHTEMWNSRVLQDNVKRLKIFGYEFIGPYEGELSSGDRGIGRMAEPEDIIERAIQIGNTERILRGKKVIITYGGTEEEIDDVRVITNKSSGKMGISLSRRAKELGAHVIAVVGRVEVQPLYYDEIFYAKSVDSLSMTLQEIVPDADILIMAAAVSDFKPVGRREGKVKRGGNLVIEFEPTEDILKNLSKTKKPHQVFVGFALESKNLLENARKKMEEKGVDMIVANYSTAMGNDFISGYILTREGEKIPIETLTKSELSIILFDKIAEKIGQK